MTTQGDDTMDDDSLPGLLPAGYLDDVGSPEQVPPGEVGPVEPIAPPSLEDGRQRAGESSGPRYVSLGRSTMTHLRLEILLTVVGLLIGLGYGVVRSPTYNAQSRLIVGKNLSLTNVAAVAGLPSAEAEFAVNYSRLISTQTVIADASKRLGHPSYLGGSLTASPVPNSAIMVVYATASDSGSAVALANAGAQALVDAVNEINQGTTSTINSLLDQYQATQVAIGADGQQKTTIQAQITALGTPTSLNAGQLSSLQNQLVQVQAKINVQQLQASALDNQYQSQYSPVQAEAGVLQTTGDATYQGSNRRSSLEIGGIGGLAAGAIVGIAGGAYLDIRRSPRSRRRNRALRSPA